MNTNKISKGKVSVLVKFLKECKALFLQFLFGYFRCQQSLPEFTHCLIYPWMASHTWGDPVTVQTGNKKTFFHITNPQAL